MKKVNSVLTLAECLFIENGWVSIPLEIAVMISKEAVNKGFINAEQYFELEKDVLGNWVTDEDGGNAGEVPVLDAFKFLDYFAKYSTSANWGKSNSKITRIGNVDILVNGDEVEEND